MKAILLILVISLLLVIASCNTSTKTCTEQNATLCSKDYGCLPDNILQAKDASPLRLCCNSSCLIPIQSTLSSTRPECTKNYQCNRNVLCEQYACVQHSCTYWKLNNCCGNKIKEPGENCQSCPPDAACSSDEKCSKGACIKSCGDSIKDPGENCQSCPPDAACPKDFDCKKGICIPESECQTDQDCNGRSCCPAVVSLGVVPFSLNKCFDCCSDNDCNDFNPCTKDSCTKPGYRCSRKRINDCCSSNEECADEDPCTQDLCINRQCRNTIIEYCCTENSDCYDADSCTTDACVSGQCQNNIVPDCFPSSGDYPSRQDFNAEYKNSFNTLT